MTSTRSAAATGLPFTQSCELEGLLQDAACMAEIARTYISDGLGFSSHTPPKLTQRESVLLYWAVSQTAFRIREAEKALLGEAGR